ncbi:MAG: NADH-quinone oxidoreductase subunit L [Acidimicrobiaceae bacterium]|nr:NADH-quinone oxidoreductase subunit L [Acidimicrobiaceae bacterium]MYC42717.1 NADH-quinone oxidoreductase subunit L [Acidimicrobiaceae bacterium]
MSFLLGFAEPSSVPTSSTVTHNANWFLEYAWLVPLLPALSFVGILFFGKRMRYKGAELGIAAVSLSFLLAVCAGFAWIQHHDDVGYQAVQSSTQWLQSGGVEFGAGVLVDGLSVMMLLVVTIVSLLVHIYSTDYVGDDKRYTHFFAFLSLFTAAMLFFVLSDNILQMIVGWELVGVCSFVLIGHWWEEKPNSDAALKAFLTNRVGDVGLIIGTITLFFAAGGGNTFDTIKINEAIVQGEVGHTALVVASVCLMAAVMSKSGQFILHTWLPDAMAGPTPVSALIHAATMVVAGVFMIARLYPVFFEGMQIGGSSINLMATIGAITLVFGGLLAFVQDDIKKVLAYSTVSQLGYMVMALGVGAWTAAVFHLFTHAFFKANLFLGSGSVAHAVHSFDMKKDMGGMRKFMPKTYVTFIIGSLALAGLFPLAGFWSKDEILVGTGGWGLFGGTGGNGAYTFHLLMGLFGAALTAAYMTRCVYLTFHGEFRGDRSHGDPHESGPRILVPLYILSGLAIVAGFVNLPAGFQLVGDSWTERFGHYVEPYKSSYFPAIDHATPSWSLAVVASVVALVGAGVAIYYYFVKVDRLADQTQQSFTELPDGLSKSNGLAGAGHKVLVNKYYLDHLYEGVIVAFTKGPLARAAYWVNQKVIDRTVDAAGETAVLVGRQVYDVVDQSVIDGFVDGSGRVSDATGEELRQINSGKVQNYAAILFAMAAVLAGTFLIIFAL